MTIAVAGASIETEQYKRDFMKISNSERMVKSADGKIKAELVGELMLAQQPESLANKILLVPTQPKGHGMVDDKSGQYDMLVEREQVSFDGKECNKIGTSYHAFNNQPGDKCQQPVASCLANQIQNFYDEDMKRILSN